VAKAFKRRSDRLVARLDDVERQVVVALLEQTREFLAPAPRESTGDTFEDLVATLGVSQPDESGAGTEQVPRDPALARLLPTANRDDPAVAAEFRRLTEYGLRERKTANLATAIEALLGADGDKVSLDQEQAQATVVALTDVRLLLGERLGLRTDEDADALHDRLEAQSEDDPELHIAAYYDFLTWLQESLIQALME
jgi:hypothetical protein